MRYYTRAHPRQLAFPYTRQHLKWSRFKRASRRAVESEWFNMAVAVLMVAAALAFVGVQS